MFKWFIIVALLLTGCQLENKTYNTPFIEMNATNIDMKEHKDFCIKNTGDMFCKNAPSVGDIKPSKKYAVNIANIMKLNNKYQVSNEWHHNTTVYEELIGDCEDTAMTIINHMVNEGIDKKYLYLVYRLTSETTAHMFVAVDTDEGLLHIDLGNGNGKPLEENINFYMPMTDVGVNKWIKGNIKKEIK